MTEPGPTTTFSVVDIAPEPYAITPVLIARIAVTDTGVEPVHAIALRCQIRVEPLRRGYTDEEAVGLADLFGPRERWATTQHTFLWQHAAAMVPGFSGSAEFALPLPCTYDIEVTGAKYLHALRDGAVQLQFLFSGTIFRRGNTGFAVQQVSWDCEARYDLPVSVWRDLIAAHYPDSGFVRLHHDTVRALADYKSALGLLDVDDAVRHLLRAEVTANLEVS
ncbi:MAG TPA: DUF6084 family protein [Mycobacterium sp.]|nr:DUF6084 family protein [Mycobacterium sp.]